MRFVIHYSGEYEDEIIISGNTIEEIREKAFEACEMRGWKQEMCWSEEIK